MVNSQEQLLASLAGPALDYFPLTIPVDDKCVYFRCTTLAPALTNPALTTPGSYHPM